jgi:hypothetical protein
MEIIFSLTVKATLNFGKFNLFILACTFMGIRHRWALKFVGNLTPPLGTGVCW